jgi:hypothetical protein
LIADRKSCYVSVQNRRDDSPWRRFLAHFTHASDKSRYEDPSNFLVSQLQVSGIRAMPGGQVKELPNGGLADTEGKHVDHVFKVDYPVRVSLTEYQVVVVAENNFGFGSFGGQLRVIKQRGNWVVSYPAEMWIAAAPHRVHIYAARI